MSDINVKRPLPLSLPIVSIAYPDGLLKSADLSSPIPVLVEMWEAAEPGYYFQLTLNGELVGDIRAFTETDKNGELFTVFLSEDLLAEHGNYRLGYMASSPYSDSHTPSPEVTLKVDRSAPGAALLAPMMLQTMQSASVSPDWFQATLAWNRATSSRSHATGPPGLSTPYSPTN
ncbi:MAG: hypothetical protein ACRER8_15475 [Pseudomonas sp.]|uniref:hypothetical protein n=1 Tax=Pseudomonas sp. TaxID=306 RepID=UPI003D6FB1EC